MGTLAEDLAAEVKSQVEAAEHFKNLWMQASEELERVKAELVEEKIAHKATTRSYEHHLKLMRT